MANKKTPQTFPLKRKEKEVDGTVYRLVDHSDALGDSVYFAIEKNLWSDTSWFTIKTFDSNHYADAVKFFDSIKSDDYSFCGRSWNI